MRFPMACNNIQTVEWQATGVCDLLGLRIDVRASFCDLRNRACMRIDVHGNVREGGEH